MSASFFFKLFPPPKFLMMTHAGLDISDDSLHCVTYKNQLSDRSIGSFMAYDFPAGLLDGGDTKDMNTLRSELKKFKEKAGLSYVRVSIPEEKAYLFQTEVPSTSFDSIRQNIESKLEENVPLAARDAIFFFDILPPASAGSSLRASVSVVPRSYIEKMLGLLHSVGLHPLAFEVVPRALAQVLVPPHSDKTTMIVHIMDRKIGVYVVTAGVVGFTSTVSREAASTASSASASTVSPNFSTEDTIAKEVTRIYEYWISRHDATVINDVLLIGRGAETYESAVRNAVATFSLAVSVPDVWTNITDITKHVPPISKDDSLAYAVAAGLAL